LKLAIDWRNRRVHSLANETLSGEERRELLNYSVELSEDHRGLDVGALVARYRANEAPSFKDAASVISVAQGTVEHFDAQLLAGLEIESYLRGLIFKALCSPHTVNPKSHMRNACIKTWGDPEKRANKSIRILRMIGFHPTIEVKGRQVPDALIETISSMTPQAAFEFLTVEIC
jgi:hypothetical protein